MSGKFIVIEGLDGSGKSTQVELLRKSIEGSNTECVYNHFPRLNKGPYGFLISKFLRGEFGPADSVHPYLVSVLFAGDRLDYNNTIKDYMANDKILISDRYVYSNIAFQCAKSSKKEGEELKKWILDFEFNHNKLVKPDISIFLNVPFDFIENNLTNQRVGEDRDYLNGEVDIHENDLELQRKVYQEYLTLVKEESDIVSINCFHENKMLSPEKIHSKILDLLRDKQII